MGITFAKENNLWCKNVYYYLAPPYLSNPPKEIEKIRKNKYDKFISKLKKIPSLIIREGRCPGATNGLLLRRFHNGAACAHARF